MHTSIPLESLGEEQNAVADVSGTKLSLKTHLHSGGE
jgi:hypothetical protein